MTTRDVLGLPLYLFTLPIYVAAGFREEWRRAQLRRSYREELERTRREFETRRRA